MTDEDLATADEFLDQIAETRPIAAAYLRGVVAEVRDLQQVISKAYADICAALWWCHDPNAGAVGSLPGAVSELCGQFATVTADLRRFQEEDRRE